MTEAEQVAKTPVEHSGSVYVHLCSGEVTRIDEVDEIALTDTHIIFTCGGGEAVVIERSNIYYTCCEAGDVPPAY